MPVVLNSNWNVFGRGTAGQSLDVLALKLYMDCNVESVSQCGFRAWTYGEFYSQADESDVKIAVQAHLHRRTVFTAGVTSVEKSSERSHVQGGLVFSKWMSSGCQRRSGS